MNKGLKKVLSYTLITTMVASMALTGFGGGARTVKAAGEALDSASLINYSTVLGRAVDFGVLAETYNQTESHSETNMAVINYKGASQINDPDLAGSEAMPYIIGNITEGRLTLSKFPDSATTTNPMILNIETTKDIIDKSTPADANLANKGTDGIDCKLGDGRIYVPGNDSGNGLEDHGVRDKVSLVYRTASFTSIENNVNSMISHIQDESKTLSEKATTSGVSTTLVGGVLDLSDDSYEGKVVYINADADLINAIASTGALTIKKHNSTVVVFNIPGAGTESSPIKINKFAVNDVDETDDTYKTLWTDKQTNSGNDSEWNRKIDDKINQKIIFNLYEAMYVEVLDSAGTFLVPKVIKSEGENPVILQRPVVNVKNSAGWMATSGTVVSKGEWHYLYRGRSTTVSSYENGKMHFAAKKAFATSLPDNKDRSYVEQNFKVSSVELTPNQYSFSIYKCDDENYSNPTKVGNSVGNDGQSKVIFPDLEFTTEGDYYYIIKEDNEGVVTNVANGTVTNATGQIKIKINVFREDGTLRFKVSSNYYLMDGYTHSAKTNSEIVMNGNEFSLGDFYNLYTETETGNFEVTKTVSGTDEASAPQTDEFDITLTAKTDNTSNTPLTGEYVATGLLTGNSVTFNSSGVATFKVRRGTDVLIKGIPSGAVITVTEANKTNYTLKTTAENLTKTVSTGTTSTVALNNEYKAPKGSLKFTKTFTGIDVGDLPANIYFKITGPGGVVGVYSLLGGEIDSTSTEALGGSDLVRFVQIDNLPVGEYTVQEYNYNVDGYGFISTAGSVTTVEVTTSNTTSAPAELSLNNNYVLTRDVTVTKTFVGLESYATIPDNFKITATYTPYNTQIEQDLVISDATHSGSITDPYVWTIEDVPINTVITFTESGYDVDKFVLQNINNKTSSESGFAVEDINVSNANTNEVTFINTYEKEKVDLTLIKKWIENESITRPTTLTVSLAADGTAIEGIVLDSTSNEVVVNNTENTWTYTKTGLPKYNSSGNEISYSWIESIPSPYTLVSNIATGINETTITNTYPAPQSANLSIRKTVTGNAAKAGETFYVTVKGEDDKYYNTFGVVVSASEARTPLTTTAPADYIHLPLQEYTIVEESATAAGYLLTTTYNGTEGTSGTVVLDTANAAVIYPIVNAYTGIGSLKITKELDASSIGTPPTADTFTVKVKLGETASYTVNTYLAGGQGQNTQNVPFTANVDQEFTLGIGDRIEIINIPEGTTYAVSEPSVPTDYENTGITNASGSIAQGTETAVNVTNKYTSPNQPTTGYLKVTKAFNAEAPAAVQQCQYTFTVSGPQGNSTDRQITITGANTETIADLPIGVYTVTENTPAADHISGYTFTGANNSGTTVEVKAEHVDADHAATITITNNYTQNSSAPTPTPIDVTCSKRETGKTEELSGASMQLIKDGVTTPVATWTSGSSAHVINSLGEGTYTLKEVNPPTDYEIAAPITFTIVDDGNGTLVAVDANNNPYPNNTIVMFDNKVPMKEVSFSKVSIGNIGKIAGAKLTLYSVGANGVLTKKIDWTSSETDVYKFTLAAGDYAIEETVAPEGYVKATSLVKFNLSFDTNGNAVIKVTEGPGTYDATNDVILIKNDPIQVTGKLSVHVEEKKTGRPVPDAEVEVTAPDGTTTTYKTNGNGEIVDANGNTPINVSAGKYKIKIKSVPKGYDVDTGEVGDVTVPENGEGRHIAKIVSSTGGLKIKVLEEGTKREVPDATVVVEAPEGVKFPDGSTKITAITDKNGNITTYTGADGKTYDLTSGLTPGDYKITVTKVPAGYNVTVGESKTCKVVKDEVAEHVALIATSSNVQPAPAPAPAPAATPAATPATPTGSITNSINVKTGDDMNVYPALIAMALSLITGVSVVAFRRKRETK